MSLEQRWAVERQGQLWPKNFLTTVRLLDLDTHEDWPGYPSASFLGKDSPKKQKIRIHFVEWTFYHLYQRWDLQECAKRLQPFFPPLEPLQSTNLRAAILRCLGDLKKQGHLGKDVSFRKSIFDDCKGERLQDLLIAFSDAVLLKVIEGKSSGGASSVSRLCLTQNPTAEEVALIMPLIIAHKRCLQNQLHNKKAMAKEYGSFAELMDRKEDELDRRFGKVVENQDFLDKNEAAQATVLRAAKILEENWQGDTGLVRVIAQGDGDTTRDELLDQNFEHVWRNLSQVPDGSAVHTRKYGLLEDLEQRVRTQKERLGQWESFKAEFQQRTKADTSTPTRDVRNMDPRSPSTKRVPNSTRRERDMVFSPRKSPKKSFWPGDGQVDESVKNQVPQTSVQAPYNGDIRPSNDQITVSAPLKERPSELSYLPEDGQSPLVNTRFNDGSAVEPFRMGHSANRTPVKEDETPDSSLSVVDIGPGSVLRENIFNAARIENESPLSQFSGKAPFLSERAADLPKPGVVKDEEEPQAPPSKASLLERTSRSMASAGMQVSLPFAAKQTPSVSPSKDPPPIGSMNTSDKTTTLLERTRQSISLVPAQSHTKRKSMSQRRNSKLYPTNQFDTPKKNAVVSNLTPPDELLDPSAGYDSVFKSRPKIAFSPTASPVSRPQVENMRPVPDQMGSDDSGLVESPLARFAGAPSRSFHSYDNDVI